MGMKMYDEATRKRWQEATCQAIKDGEDHARRIWRIVLRTRLRYGSLLGKFLEDREELRKTKHALWIARACRAKLEIRYWQSNNRNFFGYRFNVRHEITDEGRYATEWIRLWQRIENLCLEKAKEFE